MNIKEYLHKEYTINRKSQNQIAIDQNLPLDVIEYLIKRVNLVYSRTKIKYIFNEDKIDETNPIFMYYVGLIASDGYIDIKNNRVNLRLKDHNPREVLSLLIDYFEYTGILFSYNSSIELRLCSIKLIEKLEKLGIPNKNKTFELNIPLTFYNEDCFRMYLRGIHDGDGNVDRSFKKEQGIWYGGAWRLLTGSHLFIENLCIVLNKKFDFNLTKKISSRKNNKVYPQIYTKKTEGIKILSWLYTGYSKYKLEDKYKKYLSVLKDKDIV